MQVIASYLVQTFNGHSWETDAELHDAQTAALHKAELTREFGYTASEVRVVAFVGGDHGAAADEWKTRCDEYKPAGRKLMLKLAEKHGLVACNFLQAKSAYYVGQVRVG